MAQNQAISYQQNPYGSQAIMTASPCGMVAKLYEGVLINLRKTIRCIDEDDAKGRWEHNRKAYDIIEHLTLTLNTAKGGQIADNLSQLYTFMMRRLMDVDLTNNRVAAEEVIELIEPLYKAWNELDKRVAADAARTTATARAAGGAAVEQQERIVSTA